MNNTNIDNWIYGIRNMMIDNGIDDSDLSDDQCLEILMGFIIPQMDKNTRDTFENINHFWRMFYFKSMVSVVNPEGDIFKGIDIELLRAKLNNN